MTIDGDVGAVRLLKHKRGTMESLLFQREKLLLQLRIKTFQSVTLFLLWLL